ncbi:MAG: redoxin domain-containing protein [SAR324 cluster bacterium]|nr:redoxin domain-containing protein [SAR324 cluster bacterium]
MFSGKNFLFLMTLVLTTGCGDTMDDMLPSRTDHTVSEKQSVSSTSFWDQKLAGKFFTDAQGNVVSVEDLFSNHNAIVLYFTMWCPICNSHADHMRSQVAPHFPQARFVLVDYVSGSVADVHENMVSNGYAGNTFTTLADTHQQLLTSMEATMGTTIVIDSTHQLLMKEDYRDGTHLYEILESIP